MMVRWEPGCEKAPAGNACTKTGEHTIAELAELFSVSRPKVYRVLDARPGAQAAAKTRLGQGRGSGPAP
jgi:hypothetical protein